VTLVRIWLPRLSAGVAGDTAETRDSRQEPGGRSISTGQNVGRDSGTLPRPLSAAILCVVGRTRLGIALSLILLTGCWSLPGQEAPEACGFPAGTALSYAGRSTTATLGVQEVVGDPMSHDPADIYITRDAFDQGALHGRLVCAIFVNEPGFVEVTVHPDDGGRISETPEPSFAPEPSGGISRNDAVDAGREALPEAQELDVLSAEAGPSIELIARFYTISRRPFRPTAGSGSSALPATTRRSVGNGRSLWSTTSTVASTASLA
jgi:hypothetical protein